MILSIFKSFQLSKSGSLYEIALASWHICNPLPNKLLRNNLGDLDLWDVKGDFLARHHAVSSAEIYPKQHGFSFKGHQCNFMTYGSTWSKDYHMGFLLTPRSP